VSLSNSVPSKSRRAFTLPVFSEGSGHSLHPESTLHDLPLYRFQLDLNTQGSDLAQVFEQHPLLPGAVLLDRNKFAGMISRRRFLEYLLRPHGITLFFNEPLHTLYSYARSDILLLPATTPIVAAAHQALRRSPTLLNEPILVQVKPQSYALLDIHALNIAYWQIRGIETQVRYERAQAQMIQSDKMANLGRLVDGVAHEILDPVSFIWGNLSHVASYSTNLLELLAAYEHHLPNPPREIVELREDLEFDYLKQDFPKTIASIRTGAERLSKLASSLQNFCHIDEVHPKPVDLHELLDSILLLLKSRLSSEIQVGKDYGRLPPIACYPGQLNQVLMNLLSHAVDRLLNEAVSQQLDLEVQSSPEGVTTTAIAFKPTIALITEVCPGEDESSRWISVRIVDNGPGLSPPQQQQILESFSIARRAEKETSLSVSYQIITAKHGGRFNLTSWCEGEAFPAHLAIADLSADLFKTGLEFEIRLPLF